ncbi:SCO1860 family LAETG-anchored protein [Streptomyces chiangmaiensis]|uniref:SCO1860 family LAETG-anchored protein n=1 Tax=Streptomyces chiangmaiensis TaxID=766497 RepID=A0ABU7FE09_9ACTN|nr:SCO1860 family LAETG-anchored protein [Streptomyces chiangmaiensis]MED7822320.1 SCO1860 family LAETG-anchored protein [Streptomyces chiangmaiensis]
MNGTTFRMPARRLATVAVATALAAGPTALAGAGSAGATEDHGRASAVVLRTGLDVSLLNKTVNVPLTVSLNEVQAPRSAERTALSARLEGVAGGRPFDVVRADAATARATVSATGAEASTNLTHARVHVPGLPMLSLIEVDGVTSKAVCAAGRKPVATSNLLGAVTVLGRKVTVSSAGPTRVKAPGVGEVRLDVSPTRTTSRTAAASALVLTVSVNPLNLNVAEVTGTVTLGSATCETPALAAHASDAPVASATPATPPAGDVKPQGEPAKADLAETGGSSATPYVVGGAVVLLVTGAVAVGLARRRRG